MKNNLYIKLFKIFAVLLLVVLLAGCSKSGSGPNPIPENNWFYFLPYKLVEFFVHTFAGNFALAIIVSTIIVRTALWPVYAKSNAMNKNMQEMQPEIAALNAKYAGRTDQESARLKQMEMMQIYKKHGVNPLGCLLPFLQMPVFIAMYQVVTRVPDTFIARGKGDKIWSDFLWGAFDLSKPDSTYILPILVAGTMFLQQWLMMNFNKKNKTTNQSAQAGQMQSMMKMMMIIFPVMMFILAMSSPSALALYWIVGTLYSTAQMVISKKPWKKEKNNEVIDLTKK